MTEATRRRPFRGLLRTLRRTRDLVVEPGLPPGDATRVAKAIDEVLAQPETNAQRAAAERLVVAYSGLDAGGRRRFLEVLAGEFGTDPVALDRAVRPGSGGARPRPTASRPSASCAGRSSPGTRRGST